MLPLISLLAALSGFTAICVSIKKHQRGVWKRPLGRLAVLALRVAGTVLLALSWAPCSVQWGAGMGTVAWVCCVGIAPIVLVCSFAYAPRLSAFAGGLAGALAGCLSLIAFVSH